MKIRFAFVAATLGLLTVLPPLGLHADDAAVSVDGAVVKAVLDVEQGGENLLKPEAWQPWGTGFEREGDAFLCDNGADGKAQRGVGQTVVLNQTRPEPIVAVAGSKAEGVTGSPDSNYSLYLDLTFDDGTPLWGQAASFDAGTHDWQRRQVVVLPEKPVKSLSFCMLLRDHGGKAWFRDPRAARRQDARGGRAFDGVPVVARPSPHEGFQVRDVAAGSGFVRSKREALGLRLDSKKSEPEGTAGRHHDRRDADGHHRQGPRGDAGLRRCRCRPPGCDGSTIRGGARRSSRAANTSTPRGSTSVGNGRLSRYPLAAVADASRGVGLGIDMTRPAFYRARLQRRHGRVVPGLRHRPDAREADGPSAVLPVRVRSGLGVSRGAGPLLRAFPRAVPLPHARAGPVDAVCQDQRGRGLGGFRLQVQGGRRRDALGRRARHPHLPLHRADDLVDGDAQGHAADAGGGAGRGAAAGREGAARGQGALDQRLPRRDGPDPPPGCSTRPGATAPCGA